MNAADRVPIASGRVTVTRLALGAAPMGGLYAPVDDESARECMSAAHEAGIRYVDTAPLYGSGLAEVRVGASLQAQGDGWSVSTKVGRLLRPASAASIAADGMFAGSLPFEPVWDFSARGVRRSVAESLRRLGLERVDILFVHDPDDHMHQALTEAVPALVAMRDAGDVGAIGVGANQVETLRRFVTEAPIDCILMAGRYTLLDQSALDALLPECLDRAIDVFAAGVFNSGILADPDGAEPRYDYAPADAATIARARAIRDVCAQHGVPLPAAALQFPFTHPAVRSVIVGARSAPEIRQSIRWLAQDIPSDLWAALRAQAL